MGSRMVAASYDREHEGTLNCDRVVVKIVTVSSWLFVFSINRILHMIDYLYVLLLWLPRSTLPIWN